MPSDAETNTGGSASGTTTETKTVTATDTVTSGGTSVTSSTEAAAGIGAATSTGANVVETITTGLAHFFAAMDRGAALVYHKVVAMEAQVANWETTNPVIQELVSEGVAFGTTFLTEYGISVPNVELAASAVMATLKTMAASDSTVKSGV